VFKGDKLLEADGTVWHRSKLSAKIAGQAEPTTNKLKPSSILQRKYQFLQNTLEYGFCLIKL
jgi:hypothetical protein